MNETFMKEKPILPLLTSMALPMVISMMVNALYNIVDSFFVGKYSEPALTALSVIYPLQLIIIALAVGTGVGVNTYMARLYAQKMPGQAEETAGTGTLLALGTWFIFAIFSIFCMRPYVLTSANTPEAIESAVIYGQIVCIGSIGAFLEGNWTKVHQSRGNMHRPMVAQTVGALTNIMLDPILIFGLGPVPELGVRGAAWATVIGQVASAVLLFVLHLRLNREFDRGIRQLKPETAVIRDIYTIGLPAIIAQALMSVMVYAMNLILKFDAAAQTAYGLFYKVQQFVLFLAFGLRDAITPIVAYGCGMGSRKRVEDGIRYGLFYTVVLMAAGFALTELFPGAFASLFNAGQSRAYFIGAMRVISLSFVFAGINIALQGVYQALGGGMESLVLSLLRQLVIVLPLAYAFSLAVRSGLAGVSLIWWAIPIAEALSCAAGCVLLQRIRRKNLG